jgi:hypothetical protein
MQQNRFAYIELIMVTARADVLIIDHNVDIVLVSPHVIERASPRIQLKGILSSSVNIL